MSLVVVGKGLTSDIGEENAQQLADDFREYKDGDASYGDIFGRDKPFAWPQEAVENYMYHAHMETHDVTSVWDSLWNRQYPQDNFTSDKILVYGRLWTVARAPFLIVAMLNPKGHAQMEDKVRMELLVEEFEAEADDYSRRLEGEYWVTSQNF